MTMMTTTRWTRSRGLFVFVMALATCLVLLAGCSVVAKGHRDRPNPESESGSVASGTPVVTHQASAVSVGLTAEPAVVDRLSVTVPMVTAGDPPVDYVIGPHDVLFVAVKGQPESGSPVLAIGGTPVGSRVDGLGRIQLPVVGRTHVAGLTLGQLQKKLNEGYTSEIIDPQVVVELLRPSSQRVNLLGEFNRPTVLNLDRPTTVLDAIAIAGGVSDNAYLRGAMVMRGRAILPVDVYALLREGQIDQNIYLLGQDSVYIPNREEMRIIVVGDVASPGPIAVRPEGRIMLTEALTRAGGYKTVEANLDDVRIIRSLSPTRGELITVNFQKILDGSALDFELYPDDIVYVSRSGLGKWNDTIREILPTLQAISGVLNPFVRLRFLVEGDSSI